MEQFEIKFAEVISADIISCTLCGFCDASTKAYAGVVYLLLETTAGFSARFVAAKTRVAPLQQQTIPRLELLSALLLARLMSTITKGPECELTLSTPYCFTDSMVSLWWINKTWKTFVQNRVAEIIPPDCWRHCPGIENPADIPSRGATPLELSTKLLWHTGPPWLGQGELNRSAANEESQPYEECLSELKTDKIVHGLLTDGIETGLSQIINCKKFGSFERLIATTSLVLKFCRRLLNKVCDTRNSFDPRAEAEHRWILESQRMVKSDRKFEQWRSKMTRESGDAEGGFQNAAVPYSTKHPVLLHKDHPFTFLVTQKAHEASSSQWSEGNTDPASEQILDRKGKESGQ